VRKRINPEFSEDFIGNAIVFAIVHSTPSHLGLPFELSAIGHTASLMRTAISSITEQDIRSKIANLNSRETVGDVHIPSHKFDRSFRITSWSDVPLDLDLGLGLGKPQYGRKVGESMQSSSGCVLLAKREEEGRWEVMVQLTERVVKAMMEDEGLMKYVRYVT
jgi:hypothetical protein